MDKKIVIIILILILVFLIIGIVAGYFWGFFNEQTVLNQKLNTIRPLRENNAGYKFIDPLLAYIIPSADSEKQFSDLQNKINDFINNREQNNSIYDASVFFYDLNGGRWIGANEKDKYNPASMLKVVIMIAYFKKAETNPDILNKNLTYTKDIDDFIKKDIQSAPSELNIGQKYKTDDLINKMIVDSDNGAEAILQNNIEQFSLDSIYNNLDMESPGNSNNFLISPRTYSLFFRVLYSATYLNGEMSEKALDILSKTNFKDGLAAGAPAGITISHKFGEYVVSDNNQLETIELHDCGIIYYPNDPYFLCVMTKGSNLDSLKDAIKNISNLVYRNYSAMK